MAHRTVEPVPVFWLAATLVGAGMGVALKVTVGWPWLLVTVSWLLLVWLVFLATALRPSGRDGLWIGLVSTVSSTRADRMETARLIGLVEAAPGPAYGLATWVGRRSLGGHGQSGSVLTILFPFLSASIFGEHLELLFGDLPDEPHLRVNTTWKRPERPEVVEPEHVRRKLARELWWFRQAPRPEDLPPEQFYDWATKRLIEIDRRPMPDWVKSAFQIDGVSYEAEVLAEGAGWVAVIDMDSALIELQSHRIPTQNVSLSQVADVTPYLEGNRMLPHRNRGRRP